MIKKILKEVVENQTNNKVLDNIKKYLGHKSGFYHITSLNPEIIMLASKNDSFKKIIKTSQIRINDGIGVVIAARLLNIPTGPRITGVDLMEQLLSYANKNSLSVMLLGAGEKIADNVVKCQKDNYPKIKFTSLSGIKDIKQPKQQEENNIISIVKDRKPHFLFVAFGSPFQEQWIHNHQKQLKGIICMGVGGAFDFFSGNLPRPPKIIRKIGLEWLWRLIISPKRLYKQSYWIKFMLLAIKEKFTDSNN